MTRVLQDKHQDCLQSPSTPAAALVWSSMTSFIEYAAGVGEQIIFSQTLFFFNNFVFYSGSNEEEEGKKHGPYQV